MTQSEIDGLADTIFRSIDRYLDARFANLPPPVAGKDGAPGAPGKDGERGLDGIGTNGQDGQAGRDGKDGRDGRDGPPGPSGEDGVGFDDLAAELGEDGRTVVLRFTRGAVVKEFALELPVPRYMGTWRSGDAHGAKAGECFTFGGSLWIALRDTKAAPGGASRDWQLAVKAGRDAVREEV